MTGSPNTFAELRAADCYPVALYGRSKAGKPCVALLHAGRVGLEEGVVSWGVEAFSKALYVLPSGMMVVVGPGVCKDCYEGNGLRLQIRRQAREAGVGGNIVFANNCTCHGVRPRLPSSVREKKSGKNPERYMTLVGLLP
jgi:copper oxidase (laccase) domain-containing protein